MKRHWRTLLVYVLAALLILWPLLGPGYILTLDMVFAPKLALPEVVTSSYLLHASLHILNMIIPSDVVQKLLLFVILILSGLGMHRLISFLQATSVPVATSRLAVYVGGLLYMINPFTYSRFMAGQYSVLLGYAFLPFFASALLRFLSRPSRSTSLVLAAWIIGISIVSIHTLGLALVIGCIAFIQTAWRHRLDRARLKRLALYITGIVVAMVLASSYWLLPLLQGRGPTAESIATFQASDQSAFATEGNGIFSQLIHVIRLQGFWGEGEGLYLLPQERFVLWPIVVMIVWAVVVIGARVLWCRNREIGLLLLASVAIAIILAIGIGTTWLSQYVPFFAGYREPQKFVAIIALGFAVFVGFAFTNIMQKVTKVTGRIIAGVVSTVIIVGFTPVMFGGFDGQLVPRQYPSDWYAVNEQLNKDDDTFQVLFLPWHLYMRYQFAGRVIAHPGSGFFDKPIISSDNPELQGTKPAVGNSQKELLTSQILPQAPKSNVLGSQLRQLDIKYIILAKDADYASYDYLDHQQDLQLVTETETLKLYRNTAFRKDGE
jgi:hypothetical protein